LPEVVTGQGTLLFSNAGTAPPPLGLGFSDSQVAGMRFQIAYGAAGINGYPASTALPSPDVLAANVFIAIPKITDPSSPIGPLAGEPGSFALIPGSSLSGASGEGDVSLDDPSRAHSSVLWSPTFYGTLVPEPSSATLMLLFAALGCFRRWQGTRSKHQV
jgi:hypothetical protein